MVILIAAFFNDWRLEMFNRTVVSKSTIKVLLMTNMTTFNACVLKLIHKPNCNLCRMFWPPK